MPDEIKKKKMSAAMIFVVLMSIVSLFSDMTHEGASSILGANLSLAGASAAAIGFVSGLGEFIGYSLRLLTGIVADKTRRYWPMASISTPVIPVHLAVATISTARSFSSMILASTLSVVIS